MPLLNSPIRCLVNPGTGSRVTVLCTLETAPPAFYDEIRSRALDLEAAGATIHYELVRGAAEDELIGAREADLANLRVMSEAMDPTPVLAKGFVSGRKYLVPGESWENHDVSVWDAAEFYGPAHLREIEAVLRQQAEQLSRLTPELRRAIALQNIEEAIAAAGGRIGREKYFQGPDYQLSIHREQLALAAADVHLARRPGGDLAMLWSAAHLPGLTAGLHRRGYKTDGESSVCAVGRAFYRH